MRLDQAAFAFDPVEFDAAGELGFLEWDRTWGAVRPAPGAVRHAVSTSWGEHEELAGQFTSFSLHLTVPGAGLGSDTRRTPMAGLSWVAVHPDHRRRGVLTAMMRHHLHGLHESGQEAISGLFASEAVIYQRFGYGDAAGGLCLNLPSGAALRPLPASRWTEPEVTTQLTPVGPDGELAELVDEVFARTATRPGRVSRPAVATRELLRDRPWRHRDGEPNRIIVARRAGRATGYALLRRLPKWDGRIADRPGLRHRARRRGRGDAARAVVADPGLRPDDQGRDADHRPGRPVDRVAGRHPVGRRPPRRRAVAAARRRRPGADRAGLRRRRGRGAGGRSTTSARGTPAAGGSSSTAARRRARRPTTRPT